MGQAGRWAGGHANSLVGQETSLQDTHPPKRMHASCSALPTPSHMPLHPPTHSNSGPCHGADERATRQCPHGLRLPALPYAERHPHPFAVFFAVLCCHHPFQARAMEKMSDKSIPEFAPFGSTLAIRMTHLLKGAPRLQQPWSLVGRGLVPGRARGSCWQASCGLDWPF